MYVCLFFTSPEMGLVPYFLIHGTMLLNARKIRDDLYFGPEKTHHYHTAFTMDKKHFLFSIGDSQT